MALDMNNLPDLPDVRLKLRATGSPEWHRTYVYTPDGIEIGYINFFRGELFNFRFRKWRGPFDGRDLICVRLIHYHHTGEVLSEERYDWTVCEAIGRRRIYGGTAREHHRRVLEHSNIPVEVTFG